MPQTPRSVATDATAVVLVVLLVGYVAFSATSLVNGAGLLALLVAWWLLFRFVLVSSAGGTIRNG